MCWRCLAGTRQGTILTGRCWSLPIWDGRGNIRRQCGQSRLNDHRKGCRTTERECWRLEHKYKPRLNASDTQRSINQHQGHTTTPLELTRKLQRLELNFSIIFLYLSEIYSYRLTLYILLSNATQSIAIQAQLRMERICPWNAGLFLIIIAVGSIKIAFVLCTTHESLRASRVISHGRPCGRDIAILSRTILWSQNIMNYVQDYPALLQLWY